jgi:mono/diheme cytochrome c family protein
MAKQPRYDPYDEAALFPDKKVLQAPPPGTVARDDPAWHLPYVERPPLTQALLARGQERYDIYCSPCHGYAGDGRGVVPSRGFPQPPSFHSERLRRAPSRHFFNVITNGYGVMYSYARRVAPADRWAVAAYIRALHHSQHATLADVPPDQRNNISNEPSTVPSIGGTGTMGEIPAPTGAAGAGEPATLGNEAAPGQIRTPQQQQIQPLPPTQQPQTGKEKLTPKPQPQNPGGRPQ